MKEAQRTRLRAATKGTSILFPPCSSQHISDRRFRILDQKYKNEVNKKLYENSAIPIPKSAIELFQYSKTARNAG